MFVVRRTGESKISCSLRKFGFIYFGLVFDLDFYSEDGGFLLKFAASAKEEADADLCRLLSLFIFIEFEESEDLFL